MKITHIETATIRAGVPADYPHPTASYVNDGALFLKITTDDGITGLGEPCSYGAPLEQIQQEISSSLKELFIGQNPFHVPLLTVQKEPAGIPAYGNIPCQAALAGISQALWDIIGKTVKLPVFRLLNQDGDFQTTLRAYASGGMYYEHEPAQLFIDEALQAREQGFTAWKLRPQTPESASHFDRNKNPPPIHVRELARLLEKIRLAVGSDMDLMIDLGCRLPTVEQALDFAERVKELNLLFLEEPVPRILDDYITLKHRSPVPIAGGECFVSRRQYHNWLPALDIFQPDCNLVGMSEGFRITDFAQTQKMKCILHNWGNDINCAANLHLAASSPSCVLVESNTTFNPLRNHLVSNPFLPEDGFFHMNDALPGLGIELNSDTTVHWQPA